jgi:hypothetical protein
VHSATLETRSTYDRTLHGLVEAGCDFAGGTLCCRPHPPSIAARRRWDGTAQAHAVKCMQHGSCTVMCPSLPPTPVPHLSCTSLPASFILSSERNHPRVWLSIRS